MATGPLDPYVGIIEEMRADLKAVKGALLGTMSTPGLAERLRVAESLLREHHERMERHSERILAIEKSGHERLKWTAKTFFDRAIGAVAAAIVGAMAAFFASRP